MFYRVIMIKKGILVNKITFSGFVKMKTKPDAAGRLNSEGTGASSW